MIKSQLKNGINIKLIQSPKTPRTALSLFLKFDELEKRPGVLSLLNRLLLQGTKTKSAQQLADELDENAIELYSEVKNDYLRLRVFALNEDFEHSLELLEDIIKNSTFENFEKEKEKLKGELEADLDSAKVKAQDNFYKTIFGEHPYGIGATKILDNLNSISKDDVINKYRELLNNSLKNICVVGDFDCEEILLLAEKHFGDLSSGKTENKNSVCAYTLNENRISTMEKEDAKQAQIHQGWIFPPIDDKDHHKFMLLNTILGSGGMTSRLFYELREKRGLAYVVRSTLESNIEASCFTVYIATEPKNIKTCLEGFEREIERIKNIPLTDEELENAKNNLIGRRQFFYETNLLKSTLVGQQSLFGFSDNFEEELVKQIENTTKEELQECAKKYFSSPSALSVLAPSQYLKHAGLKN